MVPFPALAQLLGEPKVAALILDPAPALLFDGDGNLRFANRAAITAYGTASLQELIAKSGDYFGEMPETAREFVETLPLNGAYRRETIALKHSTETFRCERIGFSDGTQAVLFTGLARQRSDGDIGKSIGIVIDGERTPFALFDLEGKPLHANRMATTIMGPAGTLLNMHASASQALSDVRNTGSAEIPFGVLRIVLRKIEVGARSVLFASFTQPERVTAPVPEPHAEAETAAPAEAKPDNSASVNEQTKTAPETPDVIHLGPPQDNAIGWEVSAAKVKPVDLPPEVTPEAIEESVARIAQQASDTGSQQAERTAEEAASEEPAEESPAAAAEETRKESDEDKDEDEADATAESQAESSAAQELVARVARDAPTIPAPAIAPLRAATAKRTPSRFVWQTDVSGNFTNLSSDLADAVGAEHAGRTGESWETLIARAGIAKAETLLAAVERRDTWSGVSVLWPVANSETARPVELAALPVFDRERNFAGYRGFGVFRDAIPFIAKNKPAPEPEPQVELQADAAPEAAVEIQETAAPQGEAAPAVEAEIQTEVGSAAPEETHEVSAAEDEFPLHHDPIPDSGPTGSAGVAVVDAPAVTEAPAQAPDAQNEKDDRPSTEAPSALEVRDRVVRVPVASPEDQPKREPDLAALSPKEQQAFREIGLVLNRETQENDRERVLRDLSDALGLVPPPEEDDETAPDAAGTAAEKAPIIPLVSAPENLRQSERALLDRLPLGVAVHRDDSLLYANRTLLEWLGMTDLDQLENSGGMQRMFSGAHETDDDADPTIPRTLALKGPNGEPIPVETRLMSTPWYGQAAMVYLFRRANAGFDERRANLERALRAAEASTREQQAILDTATDGVLVIDRDGKLTGINKSAEALFGFDFAEIQNASFTMLFAPESHRAAVDYLDGLATNGVASVLNDGREVVGRERQGGLIPLYMTLGKIGDDGQKFCAVLRDITHWKRAEEELTGARRQAEQANLHKSDFLAKISHEMRTPLNAIIGFAEVMMEERFGPIGSERYRQYLKDIHQSGGHLISLINDLLDLSKIEAGKLELNFSAVDLNDIAQQCMSIMQPQANRERIIIRTALAENLPPVVADARSIRQIVLNLLSNSVKFTKPGGQVILSTSLADGGEVVMRVRDTGIGMTEDEVAAALEPFRQLATSGRTGSGGTGLGLPLTKALVEANRASFVIKSAVDSGTLIEVAFPSTRVLAG